MRPTILISLLEVIANNQSLSEKMSIFEIAKTFKQKRHKLPNQDLFLAIAKTNSDFYELKGLIENITRSIGIELKWEKMDEEVAMFDKDQSAVVTLNGQEVGKTGYLTSHLQNHFKIESEVVIAEINLTKLYATTKIPLSYKTIPKHPPIIEDLSAVFSNNVPIDNIVAEIKKSGSSLVESVKIVDIYKSDKIGTGKKSISFRIIYQKQKNTPTQKEVDETRKLIIISLQQNLLAKIRA